MKKILLALAVLSIAASPAFATDGVLIQWDTQWGAYTQDATDLTSLTDDFLLDSYAITWQLIYSVNATAGAPALINSANGWVSGDDTVWATRTLAQSVAEGNVIASDGTTWSHDLFYVSGDLQYANPAWTTAGYIYQRVYQGAVQGGTWYYDSTPVALVINPPTWQTSYIDAAGGGTAGIQPNQQVIPEPATMGLLGLGALVMAIRRRRS